MTPPKGDSVKKRMSKNGQEYYYNKGNTYCKDCRLLLAREAQRKYLEPFYIRRRAIIKSLGSRCYLCHRVYGVEGHYYMSGTSKTSNAWIRIIEEAEIHPERFVPLCGFCHRLVTWLENHPDILKRLLDTIVVYIPESTKNRI